MSPQIVVSADTLFTSVNTLLTIVGIVCTSFFVILGFLVFDHTKQKKKIDDAVRQINASQAEAEKGTRAINELVKKANDLTKEVEKAPHTAANAEVEHRIEELNRALREVKELKDTPERIYYPTVLDDTPFPSRMSPAGTVTVSGINLNRLNKSIEDLRGTVIGQYSPESKATLTEEYTPRKK